jgi:tetratricopeptide (TPR) repeat protein
VLALLALIGFGVYLTGPSLWAEYQYRQAEQDIKHRRFPRALERLDWCLWAWPRSSEPCLLAARTARRARDYEQARRLLVDYTRRGGPSEAVELEQMLFRAQRGEQSEEDEKDLHAILLENDPNLPYVLEALAQGYIRTFRWAQALHCLDQLLEKWPEDAEVYVWRGSIYENLHSFKAEEDYRKALDLDPGNDLARLRLAGLLILGQQFEEAARHLEQVRQNRPDDPDLLLNLARCRLAYDRLTEAAQLLDQLLTRQPRDPAALSERGKVALKQGHPAEAERWLREAMTLAPWERTGAYQFELCLRQLGKNEEADQWVDRLRRLQRDEERLSELLSQTIKEPGNLALRCEAAQLLLGHGQEMEGVTWLQSVLREDPHNRQAATALADYFQAKSDTARAEFYRKLVP